MCSQGCCGAACAFHSVPTAQSQNPNRVQELMVQTHQPWAQGKRVGPNKTGGEKKSGCSFPPVKWPRNTWLPHLWHAIAMQVDVMAKGLPHVTVELRTEGGSGCCGQGVAAGSVWVRVRATCLLVRFGSAGYDFLRSPRVCRGIKQGINKCRIHVMLRINLSPASYVGTNLNSRRNSIAEPWSLSGREGGVTATLAARALRWGGEVGRAPAALFMILY